MPNIKLKDGTGIERTYNNVDTITVPLADGTGNWTFGLTDEELTFNGDLPDATLGGTFGETILKKERSRVKFNNITRARSLFASNKMDDLSFITINLDNADVQSMFGSWKCSVLPILKGTFSFNSQYPFNGGWRYVRDPQVLVNTFKDLTPIDRGQNTMYDWLRGFSSLRGELPEVIKEWISYNKTTSGSNHPYYSFCTNSAMDTITNIPVTNKVNIDSDVFNSFCVGDFMLSRITFKLNDNTPYTANWKSQVIDLSKDSSNCFIGFATTSYYNLPYTIDGYNSGIKTTDNIFNGSSMTIEAIKERYNLLKTNSNWFSSSYDNVTYDGASRKAALLFSKFNHTSAVDLINSLPDTSAYLETAGGTNTLKLKNYSGACTDEGGTNDLTAEEIAVATAKGWTVTLV